MPYVWKFSWQTVGKQQDFLFDVGLIYFVELPKSKGKIFLLAGDFNCNGIITQTETNPDAYKEIQTHARKSRPIQVTPCSVLNKHICSINFIPSHVGREPSNCSCEPSIQVSVSVPDSVYPGWHWYFTESPEGASTAYTWRFCLQNMQRGNVLNTHAA